MIRIIKSAQLPQAIPPKPKDFLGSDAEWAALNNQDTNQDNVPDWEEKTQPPEIEIPQPTPVQPQQPVTTITSPALQQAQPQTPIPAPVGQVPIEPPTPKVPDTAPLPNPTLPPEDSGVPEWLGEEETFKPKELPKPPELPVADENEVPTGMDPNDIPDEYKILDDEDFNKVKPREENEPVDPAAMFDEVLPANTPNDERNEKYNTREKIWYALNKGARLEINYDTIPKKNKGSVNIDRTVDPQYVAFNNRTNRYLLFTQPDAESTDTYGPTEGDGWKSFAIDNIKQARIIED